MPVGKIDHKSLRQGVFVTTGMDLPIDSGCVHRLVDRLAQK
jgi:hypothetical protein